MQHPFVRHPLIRRITGYSAGSIVAIVISEACFAATLGWGHAGTTAASAAGFVGGAVPNYILNRRWAWRDRRGRNRRTEITLYMTVALASFVVSAIVTHWAERGARQLIADRGAQVALTTAAFLGVSAIFFVIKFVIYETLVFTKHPATSATASTASGAAIEIEPIVTSELEPVVTSRHPYLANGHTREPHASFDELSPTGSET